MTTAQFWNTGYIITIRVSLDDNGELMLLRVLHGTEIPENGGTCKPTK